MKMFKTNKALILQNLFHFPAFYFSINGNCPQIRSGYWTVLCLALVW